MKDDAVRALAEGRAAEVGASNPYAGRSLALAQMWMEGYESMLLQRWYTSPHRQAYMNARAQKPN
jgi:hypothetical protein